MKLLTWLTGLATGLVLGGAAGAYLGGKLARPLVLKPGEVPYPERERGQYP